MNEQIDVSAIRARLEQAGEWLMILRQPELEPEQLAAWLEWGQCDPLNLVAFERVRELASGLESLKPEQKAVLLDACLPLTNTTITARRPWHSYWRYAVAAGIACVVAGAGLAVQQWYSRMMPYAGDYTTARAQNREIALPDGTQIVLGAESSIRVAFTKDHRTVELDRGEAFFDVRHDAGRPFVVTTGGLRIKDIGTAFDVTRNADRVLVAVAEGVVNVDYTKHPIYSGPDAKRRQTPRQPMVVLSAGHQLSTDISQRKFASEPIATTSVASWREGRLHFSNARLSTVIASINRYAPHEVVIADPAVGDLRFTGTVLLDRTSDWIDAAGKVFPLRVQRDADGTVRLYLRNKSV